MNEPQGYTQAIVDILTSRLGQSISQAFTAGLNQEQKRIIDLLKDQIGSDFPQVLEIPLHTLIALIKGENK